MPTAYQPNTRLEVSRQLGIKALLMATSDGLPFSHAAKEEELQIDVSAVLELNCGV